MVKIKTIREAITDLLASEDMERSELEAELTDHGLNKSSVSRTLRLMRDSGQVEIDDLTGTVSLLSPHLSIPERADLDKQVLKYKTQAKRYKQLYEEAHHTTILQEVLLEALEQHCDSFHPVVPPPMELPDIHTVREMACLHLGDWHAGERVTEADTGGISQYNVSIMSRRAQRLAENVVNLCHGKLQGYSLPTLAMFMLGDFVSTNIHNIMANTDTTTFDSLFICANIIGQLIIDLAQHFEIHIFTVPGNHGRMTDDIEYKQQHANWDNLLYHTLRIMLQNQENVHFHISSSPFTVVRLNGWRWLLYHGGNIRSWSGIPFYGIIRAFHSLRTLLSQKALRGGQREYAVNRLQEAEKKTQRYEHLLSHGGNHEEIGELETFLLSCTREFMDMLRQCGEVAFDCVALAHFHSKGRMDLGDADLWMNGSAIGPTDYVVGRMFRGCRPRHWLHGIHHRIGPSWSYDVQLDEVPEDMEDRYKSMVDWEMERMWMQEEVSIAV